MADQVTASNEWEAFYDAHAPHYLENTFTQFTTGEVDFFLSVFPLDPGARILDVGCGPGRHAIELAKRGYRVSGVDISSGMLLEGVKKAEEAGVQVQFVKADAANFEAEEPFDAAICLCEGAFNIVGMGEDPLTHDLAVLRNTSNSLKPGAPFLFTALNGFAMIRRLEDERIAEGGFDPLTMIAIGTDTWNLPEGPTEVPLKERLYIPSEIAAMLHHAGFQIDAMYGGTAGKWGKRPLELDEVEAMFVCRKSEAKRG